MYFDRPPFWMRMLLPRARWRMPSGDKCIYLTFDDGPVPEVTPMILDMLKESGAVASFFCLGERAEQHPHIIRRILDEGHAIGHHGYRHLNGWKTANADYSANLRKSEDFLKTSLFRPPYGKISRAQYRELAKRFDIVMWSYMPGDFDPDIDAVECLRRLKDNIRDGDIVVLHDNLKSARIVLEILPDYLKFLKQQGFRTEILKPIIESD